MQKIDFDTHDEYELGDTHMTYRQIANAAGVPKHRVRSDPRLAKTKRVQVAGRPGGPRALEYDAAVHAYIQHPPKVQAYVYRCPEKREALISQLLDLWKRMTLDRAAERTGVSRRLAHYWMRSLGHKAPVRWSQRCRKEMAYARQCKAQSMRKQRKSLRHIREVLGVSMQTVRAYLKGTYDKPAPIEGRTPVWEQPPEEHGLW